MRTAKRNREKLNELVPGAIIRVEGLDDGPFQVVQADRIGHEIGLSVQDANGCRIAITAPLDRFEYELLPAGNDPGLCGEC